MGKRKAEKQPEDKGSKKRVVEEDLEPEEEVEKVVDRIEEKFEEEEIDPVAKKRAQLKKQSTTGKWSNKQRVLVFCARGVNFRTRHLMTDVRTLMPHSKKDVKLDRKDKLFVVNEVCEMKNCNNTVFFEMRRKSDLFMWLAKTPDGPSVKFLVENVHTMDELRLTGNHLKGSRPLLSFDSTFEEQPHLQLLKEMLIQIYGTPNYHPKSKPFVDHVLNFSWADNRVWFRNYQIVDTEVDKEMTTTLNEVGPRFVLNPIRIFAGSFCGATLWENPFYVSPNEFRRQQRRAASTKYLQRVQDKEAREQKKKVLELPKDELDGVFDE
eukprot:Colp12_sorted_trinity150504_noHs@18505